MKAMTRLCTDKEVEAFDDWQFSLCQKLIDESFGLLSLAERSYHKTAYD